MRELQQGGPKADGSMSMSAFWKEIYLPVKSKRWSFNTRKQAEYVWRLYIEPVFGGRRLNEISKASIDLHLVKMATEEKGRGLVECVYIRIHSILEEAVDNDFIPKNPARKIELPACKPPAETRSLTEAEVRKLWDATEGKDYLIWRVMLMTGARIGEVLALTRGDILPPGLCIDESALNGQASTTKNRKTRVAPLPSSLRAELEEWLSTHENNVIFPRPNGSIDRRSSRRLEQIVSRGRKAASIPDLTFRMCRTTFATLFEGDIRDAQEILGHHSSAFTLQVYRKPISARQQAFVEALDRRLRVVTINGKKGAA
jgi:integrase